MSVETIRSAMAERAPRTIRLNYTSAKGEISRRHVEPYEITEDTLFAWCKDREEIRRFKLDRISDVTICEIFLPRYPIKLLL